MMWLTQVQQLPQLRPHRAQLLRLPVLQLAVAAAARPRPQQLVAAAVVMVLLLLPLQLLVRVVDLNSLLLFISSIVKALADPNYLAAGRKLLRIRS